MLAEFNFFAALQYESPPDSRSIYESAVNDPQESDIKKVRCVSTTGFALAQAHALGQARAGLGIVGRHHGIIGW